MPNPLETLKLKLSGYKSQCSLNLTNADELKAEYLNGAIAGIDAARQFLTEYEHEHELVNMNQETSH